MIHVALASAPYGSGRIVFLSGRLNARNTAGDGLPSRLIRNCLEWASALEGEDWIEVCHVPFETVDATVPAVDEAFNIGVERQTAEFLSEDENLSEFDCIVLAGYRNTLSPLVRANVMNFVSAGGGLVLCDVAQEGALDLLSGSVSLSVASAGSVLAEDGYPRWTEAGRSHAVFSRSLLGVDIPLLADVRESSLGSAWTVLNVFDTEATARENDADVEEQLFLSSDDYSVPGKYFVGYYATVYENGFANLKREE